jgi:hypothetical protein
VNKPTFFAKQGWVKPGPVNVSPDFGVLDAPVHVRVVAADVQDMLVTSVPAQALAEETSMKPAGSMTKVFVIPLFGPLAATRAHPFPPLKAYARVWGRTHDHISVAPA